jgi:hypothetical protein
MISGERRVGGQRQHIGIKPEALKGEPMKREVRVVSQVFRIDAIVWFLLCSATISIVAL